MKMIPMNDLTRQYQSIKSEIDNTISRVIEECSFISGPYVKKFEQEFGKMFEFGAVVACANGTDALEIAIQALKGHNVKGSVIVSAHSWISSASCIINNGLEPIFCDLSPDGYNLDAGLLEGLIREDTIGIIAVHLYGHPCEMDKIVEIANRRELWVIEDCAQAHLATYKDKLVGTYGDLATFSFYPGKNLGGFGDAGCIAGRSGEIMTHCRMIANHGGLKKHSHELVGRNSRMDGLQGAILRVKLNHIKSWTKKRREIAEKYISKIDNEAVYLPKILENTSPAWHLFTVRTKNRTQFREYLNYNGVASAISYPVSLSSIPCLNIQKSSSNCEISSKLENEICSIPIFPEMTFCEVEHIIKVINEYVA